MILRTSENNEIQKQKARKYDKKKVLMLCNYWMC